MAADDRYGTRLNAALHELMADDDDLFLLGEDVADPYGGAFKITKGLSTAFPGRVLSTPISEAGMIGLANGLALAGHRVIAEVMFGDFAALAFDQLLNFSSKSVGMYGRRLPMPIVVRCPVGGHRGYGPTHSQSLQKHFIGIPHLTLFELSAFHDPHQMLRRALERGEPAVVFEPKLLYGARGGTAGDELLEHTLIGDGDWAHLSPRAARGPEVVLITTGGSADLTIEAAKVLVRSGAAPHVLVPGQIYPLRLDPVLSTLRRATVILTVEESTAGGTWGAEVAAAIHHRLRGEIRQPVINVHSRDSVIPAAPHLERAVLVSTADVVDAARQALDLPIHPARTGAPGAGHVAGHGVTVPKLNNNDDTYLLLSWLAEEGAEVRPGDPIAEIETSKAVEEIEATAAGTLVHEVVAGSPCAAGTRIARIVPDGDVPATAVPERAAPATTIPLTSVQQQVAAVVSRSRREIPDAFVMYRTSLEVFHDLNRTVQRDGQPALGLLEVLVKAIGELRPIFPNCFARLDPGGETLVPATAANVSVTMDAGNGLFMPVLRDVENRDLDDVADALMSYRMQAFHGRFAAGDLDGATIAVSWNHEPGVVAVQPVIPPGLACVLAVGGPVDDWADDGTGRPVRRQSLHLALAHDHRIVNGAEAVRLLAAISEILTDPEQLSVLTKAGTGPA